MNEEYREYFNDKDKVRCYEVENYGDEFLPCVFRVDGGCWSICGVYGKPDGIECFDTKLYKRRRHGIRKGRKGTWR